MEEIVSSIRRVSDIVAEISSASVEQSTGVQQVGEAVSQMDQATQQNAALVEESAAAAESLKSQAAQLVQAVAVFKLSRQDGPAAASRAALAAAGTSAAERLIPNRSKPVTRRAVKVEPLTAAAVVAAPAAPVLAATGHENWETF
jgi:hypothetical protein